MTSTLQITCIHAIKFSLEEALEYILELFVQEFLHGENKEDNISGIPLSKKTFSISILFESRKIKRINRA